MCTMVYFSHLAMSKGEGALHHDPPFKIRCLVQWYTKPDIWARDIWAQRHLGAKTFGREMRSSALPTIIFYFFQKKIFTKILYFQRC